MLVLKNWHGLLNPAGKHRGMVYNHDLYVAPTLYKEKRWCLDLLLIIDIKFIIEGML